MIAESTREAKVGMGTILNQQRKQILIPISQIKRKMPEIGQTFDATTPADGKDKAG